MSAYWAVLTARFRMLLQYRAAALAGLCTQLFWGLLRVMIFDAFYRSSSAIQPMSFEQTVTYLWLIQAMLLLLPWRLDWEVRAMI
ncbi:MAG: ABC transporter permease, partial [Chloroflexi bacterium]|nr:ABC transporter permease [Chloroflexota bacterium]